MFTTWLTALRARLIDDARLWWRMWSVQGAALFGLLAASITANPGLLLGLIAHIPDKWRGWAAVATFIVTFGVPTLLRLVKQPEKPDAE